MDPADVLTGVARRHGLGGDAVRALWEALVAGRGAQAQFSHPELGGMGQWSGGMVQIGDMFDTSLKAKVAAACADLAPAASEAARRSESDAHQARGPGEDAENTDSAGRDWWPEGFGTPSSTGSQNDTRYALFPQRRRMAIRRDGRVKVYDTGEHRISGFGQQQGHASSMAFTSQFGAVDLDSLRTVDDTDGERTSPAPASLGVLAERSASVGVSSSEGAAGLIEASVPMGALTGGCFCGRVRYEAEGQPFHETLCHCADCRRASGAPAVAWFTVPRKAFGFTGGEPKLFRSSERALRRFCPTCGTQLTWEGDKTPNEIDITIASLDAPDAVEPRTHSYAGSRLAWDHLDPDLPERS